VETENLSACVKANCKLCKSEIVLNLSVIKIECVIEVLINPIIRTRTRHSRRSYCPTPDNIIFMVSRNLGYLSFHEICHHDVIIHYMYICL
jgi:hypothetical protein